MTGHAMGAQQQAMLGAVQRDYQQQHRTQHRRQHQSQQITPRRVTFAAAPVDEEPPPQQPPQRAPPPPPQAMRRVPQAFIPPRAAQLSFVSGQQPPGDAGGAATELKQQLSGHADGLALHDAW